MSLERRVSRMRSECEGATSAYDLIAEALKRDRSALFAHFKQNMARGSTPLDEEIAEVYELKAAEVPELKLPNNLLFVSGFSYISGHWYSLIRIVGSGEVAPEKEQILNSHLERIFPDEVVTVQQIKEALLVDPSGATWLEEKAKKEFRVGTLELVGAKKVIRGIRRMYEALTTSSSSSQK